MAELHLPVLLLLIVANGAPVLGHRLLGDRFAWRLDGGLKWRDGRDLLGPTKTMRGVVLSVILTAAIAMLLDISALTGGMLAVFAMLGDAASSFVKRRLNIPPSGEAFLLDQLPESLLPLLACQWRLGLQAADIAWLAVLFLLLQKLLSRILYRLHVRRRPY